LDTIGEPSLETISPATSRQKQDSEANFAEDDRIDSDIPLIAPQPRNHASVWNRLRWLAQDVRVDEKLHSVSVDSDSIGAKKPFSGQARSQSTIPSFGTG